MDNMKLKSRRQVGLNISSIVSNIENVERIKELLKYLDGELYPNFMT